MKRWIQLWFTGCGVGQGRGTKVDSVAVLWLASPPGARWRSP